MRFMLIVRSQPEFEAETSPDPDPAVFEAMARFHEELARAGVLLDAAGLHPSRKGWRVVHGAGAPRIVDGPFAEAKELIAGYTLIQARSRDEALEWSRRFPNPASAGREAVVEVRQLIDLDEFTPGDTVESFRRLLQP
ncbi:MAG: YciI family protein [Hydrogenophaga sp.]|uniref:YciI family protein n=1 Tax=Hydrogenophaga sp. TaxID=1904254 RepID=UPI001D6FD3D1|nr:YciI family protein [Hydrogenophaga sp.]MBX3611555.1 YciI family protein [Hydrogenophaga sp.]